MNTARARAYGGSCGFSKSTRCRSRFFAVALALEKYPEIAKAFVRDGHEICSHGYRWINYQDYDIKTEREHMRRAIDIITRITGERPLGWYTGRTSPNTRDLVMEEGGFVYDADDYSDDLPFWDVRGRKKAAGGALYARFKRHALCHRAGF